MCQQRMLEAMSSEENDDVKSSDDEEGDHNVLNLFPGGCGAKQLGHAC